MGKLSKDAPFRIIRVPAHDPGLRQFRHASAMAKREMEAKLGRKISKREWQEFEAEARAKALTGNNKPALAAAELLKLGDQITIESVNT